MKLAGNKLNAKPSWRSSQRLFQPLGWITRNTFLIGVTPISPTTTHGTLCLKSDGLHKCRRPCTRHSTDEMVWPCPPSCRYACPRAERRNDEASESQKRLNGLPRFFASFLPPRSVKEIDTQSLANPYRVHTGHEFLFIRSIMMERLILHRLEVVNGDKR